MNPKLRAYLDLVRLPNLPTAAADVVAGALYAGGDSSDWPAVALLVCASMSLYAGGSALNDVCDVKRDTQERPERPIPSGRVPRRAGLAVAVAALLVGFALAALVSARTAWIAGSLVIAIVLYDVLLKATPIAPGVMGACRALNLAFGMSRTPLHLTAACLVPLGLMWLYVTSLTLFARKEAAGGAPWALTCGTAGVCLAVGALVSLLWILPTAHPPYLLLTAALVLFVGYRGMKAVATPQAENVQRATATFVMTLVFFDACLTWAACGPYYALAVAALIVPSALLGRLFRVT